MKPRVCLLLFFIGLIISLLVITGSTAQPAQAERLWQDTTCDEILTRILARAGWEAINQSHGSCEYLGVSSNFYITTGLSIDTGDGSPYVVNSCGDDSNTPCIETSFHGYPAITAIANGAGNISWTMPRGKTEYSFYIFVGEGYDVMEFAEEIINAAESELPSSDQVVPEPKEIPTGPFQSNSDCAGVTPQDLRDGGLKTLSCRLHCDPNIMSDDDLQICINQYSGQSGITEDNSQGPVEIIPPDNPPDETILVIPENQTSSDQPKSLGPLATTPLIPLAGGLIGTVVGWLVSVGVTSGNLIKTVSSTPPPSAPRPLQQMIPQSPRVATSLPLSPANPPPLVRNAPSAAPIKVMPGPFELGFNLVKDTVGAIGNISGVFNKYFAGPDTAEIVIAIRNAVKTWHDAPSVQSAKKYLENLGKSNALREPGISKKLGVVGKGLDVVEAVVNARKICTERGYTGFDAVLTTYAQVGKKAVVWGLTKNPVVALADAAFGGASQLAFGAKNKIDIGAAVDKSAEAWDNVTRHAADRYYRVIEKNADNDRIENLKYLTERIRQQVVDGKISPQEGARRLQNVIDKTNQESPLI